MNGRIKESLSDTAVSVFCDNFYDLDESIEVISNVQPLNKSRTFNPLENVTPFRR